MAERAAPGSEHSKHGHACDENIGETDNEHELHRNGGSMQAAGWGGGGRDDGIIACNRHSLLHRRKRCDLLFQILNAVSCRVASLQIDVQTRFLCPVDVRHFVVEANIEKTARNAVFPAAFHAQEDLVVAMTGIVVLLDNIGFSRFQVMIKLESQLGDFPV